MTKMNLQLFAFADNGINTLAPNNPETNKLSAENKIYYDMTLLDSAEPELVHNQFGQKRPIPKNGGKTINFRRFTALRKATAPLTEGVTPEGTELEVSVVPGTVEQYGAYVKISDMVDLTAIDPVVEESVKLLGSQAGRTLDTVTRDIINAGTNVMYVGGVSGSSAVVDPLGFNDIFEAAAILKGQNAKPIEGGSYVAIVHPYVAYDLMVAAKDAGSWVDVNKYANPEAIFNGELGKIGGVRIVESTEAKIKMEGSKPIFCTMVIGANAYGVTEVTGGGLETIIKPFGAGDDPLNQRATCGWKATQTAERLDETAMVRIESSSTLASKITAAN